MSIDNVISIIISIPVCIATQFLDELANSKKLCPSELNDVFLAMHQKSDLIMLAGEVGGSPNSQICLDGIKKMIKANSRIDFPRIEGANMQILNKTKIMATMGPTLQTVEEAKKMINLGVEEYRIHMGLRTRDFCSYFENIRIASNELDKPVKVLLDLPSSRPRVANIEEHLFRKGDKTYIYDNEVSEIPCNNAIPLPGFSTFTRIIKKGEHIFFRDGHVDFEFVEVEDSKAAVVCRKSDLSIKKMCSCNFNSSAIEFEPVCSVDINYLNKMKQNNLIPDMVAISFASNVNQIVIVKRILSKIWPKENIKIICKIESRLGLKNIDDLITNADGIMVARGDLLQCIDPYMLPQIQFNIVRKCRDKMKYVCVATEFFERFAESGIVNRSELSDVALAAREGADTIMLARETGNSEYNFEGVKLINKILELE